MLKVYRISLAMSTPYIGVAELAVRHNSAATQGGLQDLDSV